MVMRNISLTIGGHNTLSAVKSRPIIITASCHESRYHYNYLYVVYVFLTDIYALYAIKKVICD